MNPDYSARKRGLPTMPITERIKRNITVNPITKCCKFERWGRCELLEWLQQPVKENDYD